MFQSECLCSWLLNKDISTASVALDFSVIIGLLIKVGGKPFCLQFKACQYVPGATEVKHNVSVSKTSLRTASRTPERPTEQQTAHNTHFLLCCNQCVLKIPATRKCPGTRRNVVLGCRELLWSRRQYSCRTGGRRMDLGVRSSRSYGDNACCLSEALEEAQNGRLL